MTGGIDRHKLSGLLDAIGGVAVGVIGDFCLDAYWELDAGEAEISVETGKPTRAVRGQRYSPGGAGNVASNLVDIGARQVAGFGVLGDDLFGRELLALLRERRIDTTGMVIQKGGWDTPVYAKPYIAGQEQERFDFGRWKEMSGKSEQMLIGALRARVPTLDALIINQQLIHGPYSDALIAELNRLAAECDTVCFLLDARDIIGRFRGMTAMMNAAEAARACGVPCTYEYTPSPADLREHARTIAGRSGKPVLITCGTEGLLAYDGTEFNSVPAISASGPTDPVGAGDTAAAAAAAALGARGTLLEAAALAAVAASVTVRKLGETGTASQEEILSLLGSMA
ncbi:MAG TPA: PfkB family carbohydrate kinase [Bacteroidota bacterium]|nr:PfkB family carbohydrate kinase [Bacteroidota bacterium]